jgi:hypothetical protein
MFVASRFEAYSKPCSVLNSEHVYFIKSWASTQPRGTKHPTRTGMFFSQEEKKERFD